MAELSYTRLPLAHSPHRKAGAAMSLDLVHDDDRLARIGRQLTVAKQTAATMSKSDRLLARQLISQLDAMLRELLPPTPKPSARGDKRK
jgi:hypothetical protein